VYGVASKRKGTGENDLIKLAHRVFKNEITLDSCKLKIAECTLHFCDDNTFSRELSKKNYEWKHIKYLLIEYALSLQRDDRKEFILTKEPKKFQIEHIASQVSMNETEAIVDELVQSIGNLSITYDDRNQEYSNKPFKNKIALYQTSELAIEKNLASKKKWESRDIKARTKEIVSWALKRWSTK
jgi:hypothetical protein